MITHSGITSRIAICSDCDWRGEDYTKQALAKARKHAIKYKHYVGVETARYIRYDCRRGSGDNIEQLVLDMLPNHGTVLDVGCGVGSLCKKMEEKGLEVQGCDIFESESFDNVVCDLNEGIPFADNSFDIVTCVELIEHLENPFFHVREIKRVLKPNGLLILSTPNVSGINARLTYLAKLTFPLFFHDNDQYHINPILFKQFPLIFKGFNIVEIKANRYIISFLKDPILSGECLIIKAEVDNTLLSNTTSTKTETKKELKG